MSKDEIIKAVNNILSNYWWGGKVVDLQKNEYDEWIADCKIYLIGEWGGKFYKKGEFILCQKMVWIRDGEVWPKLFDAKDNKRLPTFAEDGGLYDENAPKSPYIKTYEPSEKMVF